MKKHSDTEGSILEEENLQVAYKPVVHNYLPRGGPIEGVCVANAPQIRHQKPRSCVRQQRPFFSFRTDISVEVCRSDEGRRGGEGREGRAAK